jgi:hypothetical protein
MKLTRIKMNNNIKNKAIIWIREGIEKRSRLGKGGN